LLDEEAEKKDTVAEIYRKSALYLVSRSYQERGKAVPLMGMAMFKNWLKHDGKPRFNTNDTKHDRNWTASASHGGVDNDPATMNSMMKLIVGRKLKK